MTAIRHDILLFVLAVLFITGKHARLDAQPFAVDTMMYNGDPAKFINIVYLGDGFRDEELAAYLDNVYVLTDYLFSRSPFREYIAYFNVFAISVPSAESGTTHPGTATDVNEPVFPVAHVHTYFSSSFDRNSIHRLLVPQNFSAVNSVLINHFPQYDQRLMLVNSPHYGGSGGALATTSLHNSAFAILVHEIGHSFAGLADEYFAGDSYASERPNMTRETDPASIKWKNWLGEPGIGVFQHCCSGQSAQWYKPTHNSCIMQSLNHSFCVVCSETIVKKIHQNFRSPILDSYPEGGSMLTWCGERLDFQVSLVAPEPNTLEIRWLLGSEEIAVHQDTLAIVAGLLEPGINHLQMQVVDNTPMIRDAAHLMQNTYTVQWTIYYDTIDFNPGVTVGGPVEFCAGDSVELIADAGYNYLWSDGSETQSITAFESGQYAVTISTPHGCTAEMPPIVIDVHPLPRVPQVHAVGNNLVTDPGRGIQWYQDGEPITGETSYTLEMTTGGDYFVCISDADGCTSCSDPYRHLTTSTGDHKIPHRISIVPNPGTGSFYLAGDISSLQKITIHRITGEPVYRSDTISEHRGEIDLTAMPAGVYVVFMSVADEMYFEKLILL